MANVWHIGSQYPKHHMVITPDDAADLKQPMIVYAGADGTITVQDHDGTEATYNLLAGQNVPVRAYRVMATGTTATDIVGVY